MTTSSQLPVVRNIDILAGAASTVQIALGTNISQGWLQANAYMDSGQAALEGSGFISSVVPLSLSIANAATGDVAIAVSQWASFALRRGGSWDLKATGVSAEDPPDLVRTLCWGRVSVAAPAELSPSSPLYHAVEMVSGDEFTFQVNLGMSVSRISLSARLVSPSGTTESGGLPISVVSASQGVVNVTIDEDTSRAVGTEGWSWILLNSQTNAALRAGPITAYRRSQLAGSSAPPVGSTSAAQSAPPQIGSVFL